VTTATARRRSERAVRSVSRPTPVAADNATEAGRALNRRVSVNILVSKALEDL